MPDEAHIRYEKHLSGTATITLNRPEALNAINMAMRDDLWTFIHAARLDPDVRVLIFRGEGPQSLLRWRRHLRVRHCPITPRVARGAPAARPLGAAGGSTDPHHRGAPRILLRSRNRTPPLLRPPNRRPGHTDRTTRGHARLHPLRWRNTTDASHCPRRCCTRSDPQRRPNRRPTRAGLGHRAPSGSDRRPRSNRRCHRPTPGRSRSRADCRRQTQHPPRPRSAYVSCHPSRHADRTPIG